MRRIGPAARGLALVTLGSVFLLLIGLEALYLWWLPRERPVRAARPLPPIVRAAIWIEFRGQGPPRLDPHVPFLVPHLIAAYRGGSAQDSLLHFAARSAIGRPLRQHVFLGRASALSTWLSRNWTIEEVLDSVGAHAWMGDAGEGVEAGARYFWGKPLESLSVAEVATLMASMRSANGYDPACRPQSALEGRANVLERMREAGLIDESVFLDAMAAPLRVRPICNRTRSGTS